MPKCPKRVPHTLDFWVLVAVLATRGKDKKAVKKSARAVKEAK